MKRSDPYADLAEVYAAEVSHSRVAVQPTPKTPTDEVPAATPQWAELIEESGMHIDGDRRYQER